ncbi:MAG: LptF/LptG family permease [Phycisphaerales bacterium]
MFLLVDRYLIRRFLTNFVILFLLMYILATSIDVILQLDEFMKAVRARDGQDNTLLQTLVTLSGLILDYHGPRLFQLYAYLLGLATVGAMGFTLAQMQRHRELVAMLASGMSMYRIAWPILVAAFVLNLLHMVNSNVILPRLAPDLIRSHGELESSAASAFPIPFTADSNGSLLQARAFLWTKDRLERPTILVRDARGRTSERIAATAATWDETAGAWRLEDGRSLARGNDNLAEGSPDVMIDAPADLFVTDLSPRVLMMRRYRQFAQMLGPQQIQELMQSEGVVDVDALARIRYGRYSVVLSNMLLLIITLPFFLTRAPGNLLRRSVSCAGVALAAMLGSVVGMEVPFEALSPAASVFFPVIVLVPLAIAAMTFVRS